MERVKEGDLYFFIRANRHLKFTTGYTNDVRSEQNDLDYESGNYFLTNDDACEVIAKLQAVLKGADVIEMPSEEEIKMYSLLNHLSEKECQSIYETISWLKTDKIVK